jgi:predicted membrane-bound dolichyl-phosphate-mannose-protein mannosyltransferase
LNDVSAERGKMAVIGTRLSESVGSPPPLRDTPSAPHTRQAGLHPRNFFFSIKEHWELLCLVVVLLALHLIVVNYTGAYVYDEQIYVPQALSIVHERGPQVVLANPGFLDHPALAKLFIAAGVATFGDNRWGWRIPSIMFGIASVVVFYFICRKLGGKGTALLSSLLLVCENFYFTFSGLAMLDVFSVTFMLCSFLFFLDERYVLSGATLAAAGLCKLPGLFGILAILGYWALDGKRADIRKIGLLLLSLVLVFFALMPVIDFAATNQWFSPVSRVHDMLVRAESLKYSRFPPEVRASMGMAYPWDWILRTGGEWLGSGWTSDARVVCLKYTPMFFVLIVPSVLYMAYEAIAKRKRWAVFGLLWFGATYLVWIPIELVTDRAMFPFYFLPAVGAVCMAIGCGIQRIWQMSNRTKERGMGRLLRGLVLSCLVLYVGSFLLYSILFIFF